ncbi:MAG: cytochrome c [Anaerolineales bacterium]|jgi:cytochrome c553|nr:cytochrome c [Anaerolineales bacterium]
MNKYKSTRYSCSILFAAMLIWTMPILSGCQGNAQQVNEDILMSVDTSNVEPIDEDTEIDELFGIPEISMAELAESMDAETLYINNCAKCHGLTGLGDGPSVGSLSTQSGLNLTILQEMSDEEIKNIISVGKGMEMPPWELLLDDDQLQVLTEYVRTLANSK